MASVRDKANKIALELINEYQTIKYKGEEVSVPYFINTAEQEYKAAMKIVGIKENQIKKIFELIKTGQTSLGSTGGKGTPSEIEKDLKRLVQTLTDTDRPKTKRYIRAWMKEMHIGLDCSGFVYNILKNVEDSLEVKVLDLLAWADSKTKKASHAGVFIFDTDKLETVKDLDLKPLDILVFKDHIHVGIILNVDGKLCLADCSMGNNGISFYAITVSDKKLTIVDGLSWNQYLREENIIIKRLKL